MAKKANTNTAPKHTYSPSTDESESTAVGGPIDGFNEDDEYRRERSLGFTFAGRDYDEDENNPSPVPPDEAPETDLSIVRDTPHGITIDSRLGENEFTRTEAPIDLRSGGRDISGISEYSLRAHDPQLDDGIDSGDYARSDVEIGQAVAEVLRREDLLDTVETRIEAGTLRLRGTVRDEVVRLAVEQALEDIPGVRMIENQLVVSS